MKIDQTAAFTAVLLSVVLVFGAGLWAGLAIIK